MFNMYVCSVMFEQRNVLYVIHHKDMLLKFNPRNFMLDFFGNTCRLIWDWGGGVVLCK